MLYYHAILVNIGRTSMFMTILCFLIVTGLVVYISWLKTKGDDLSTARGYFLAGRGLVE